MASFGFVCNADIRGRGFFLASVEKGGTKNWRLFSFSNPESSSVAEDHKLMSTQLLRWGILGTGNIARKFASELPHAHSGRLAAVGSRTSESAARFAADFPGVRPVEGYEALLADSEVDAVYIATPHPDHARLAILAAEAGKHVLCEKPAALNRPDAMVAIEAARRQGALFMEAFMYKCHPRTARIAQLVSEGAIGRVRLIEASFCFAAGFHEESRLSSPELGGGGILDVGCYTVSVARMIAGAAQGRPFAEPVRVEGVAIPAPTGVDAAAGALLEFPAGILAQLTCGVSLSRPADLRIFGDEGSMEVPTFWNPPGPIEIRNLDGSLRESISTDSNPWKYAIQADAFAAAISAPETAPVPTEDTLGNMEVLDLWRQRIAVAYPSEAGTHPSRRAPISGKPLQFARHAEIPSAEIPGLGKRVSRLVLGVDNQLSFPQLAAMADDFFERGGNAFDTAHIYGGGVMESLLGQWLENRGVREQVAVIVKGAHTPFCDPENLLRQLEVSLERLHTDHADIYFMHRDNPDIPVGEFVDVLDAIVADGRVRLAGVSNWTLRRIHEANAYAEANGRRRIAAVSNNFSLARMVQPVWSGCEAASAPEWREWLEASQCPLFAWSSQARGYFLDGPATGVAAADILRCWDSSENRLRRERAGELARKKGVSTMNIALAYVLAQKFPVFALIGPRRISELNASLPALAVSLAPEEVAWLDSGAA